MIKTQGGEIILHGLPKTGVLNDGTVVDQYYLLDREILKNEGWLPLYDNKPSYDNSIESAIEDGYEVLEDRVVKRYKVIPNEEVEVPMAIQQFDTMMKGVRKILKESEMSNEELLEMSLIYPTWESFEEKFIPKNEIVRYKDKLYRVIKGLNWLPNHNPEVAQADFTEVVPKGVIPEWKSPTGGHDAYNIGDQVTYKSEVWESKINGNTTIPDGDKPYNRYWKLV